MFVLRYKRSLVRFSVSKGRISINRREHSADLQRALLEAERVEFDADGTVDWDRFGWAVEPG